MASAKRANRFAVDQGQIMAVEHKVKLRGYSSCALFTVYALRVARSAVSISYCQRYGISIARAGEVGLRDKLTRSHQKRIDARIGREQFKSTQDGGGPRTSPISAFS